MSETSAKDKTKKANKKEYKRANRFAYWFFISVIARFILKVMLHTGIDKTGLEELIEKGGPALVVSSHTSNLDFLYSGLALYPNVVTFVGSHHFTLNKITNFFMRISHAIPKKMFCADVNTIITMLRARDKGQIIVLYPEGRLPCAGNSVDVTDGTAELVKKLGVDVYWITQDGAYKSVPKWAGLKFRPGRVLVHGGKLFSKEEIKDLTKEEIYEALQNAIRHDDDKVLTDVRYRCKNTAEGLDGILYKCPVCADEFKMTSSGRILSCGSCGSSWELDEKYVLHGPVFDHINEWYDWQMEVLDTDDIIDSPVGVGTVDSMGKFDKNAGHGRLVVDRDTINFDGEVFGEPLKFTEKTTVIPAFPASVADHVSMYSKHVLYYFYPEPDRRYSVRWVQYLDKVTKERKAGVSISAAAFDK